MTRVSRVILCALAVFAPAASVRTASTAPQQEKAASAHPAEVISLESLPQETAEVTAMKKAVESEIDGYGGRMIEMNDWLYHHPESGFEEVRASKLLAGELESHGFQVKSGVAGLPEVFDRFVQERFHAGGLPTAFVAKYKGGDEHPVICFMLEADALRAEKGPFHGCQHNQQGPAAVGAAIALSKVMEANRLPGSVWVIHCPAEEIPPSTKAAMTEAGVFDQVDFLIRSHGTPAQAKRARAGLGNCCMLIESCLYTFTGKPAHGTRAWQGHDALDAARLFFTAVDMLREHSEPAFRFMGTITKVGQSPNVVNDRVEVDHWIRNSDRSGIEAIRRKRDQLDAIARGSAMAAFCDVDIQHYSSDVNGIESAWMEALAWRYTNEYGDAAAISEELSEPSGWDESGIGAVNVPGVTVKPAVADTPEVAGHSYENAAITISPEGHKGLVQTARIESVIGLRLLTDPDLRARIKEEHARWQDYGLATGMIQSESIRKRRP